MSFYMIYKNNGTQHIVCSLYKRIEHLRQFWVDPLRKRLRKKNIYILCHFPPSSRESHPWVIKMFSVPAGAAALIGSGESPLWGVPCGNVAVVQRLNEIHKHERTKRNARPPERGEWKRPLRRVDVNSGRFQNRFRLLGGFRTTQVQF